MSTIGLLSLLGCLPKYLGNQCLDKGNCEAFNVTGESAASESPFEISRDDIAVETRVTNFQLTDRALLAQTEVRETCRALHLATKTYALTQEKWYHKPFKGYVLEEPIFVNGQYEPCSEWKVDSSINLAAKFKNVEGAPLVYPLQRTQSHVQFSFASLESETPKKLERAGIKIRLIVLRELRTSSGARSKLGYIMRSPVRT